MVLGIGVALGILAAAGLLTIGIDTYLQTVENDTTETERPVYPNPLDCPQCDPLLHPPREVNECPGCGVEPPIIKGDRHLDRKGGGKDPFVLEPWNYFTFDAYKCSNAVNSFDYDNDGYPEHMCYWYTPETRILFNDIYNNQTLVNGNNFKGIHTHIWQDLNSNVFIDEGELTPFSGKITMIVKYTDGLKLPSNGRYSYGVLDVEGFEDTVAHSTKPTYWQTQEWMKQDSDKKEE